MTSSSLPDRLEARTQKVEDLVARVRQGLIRVPDFQRPLKWEAGDVEDLFDSIYRGFPVGSLLFFKRPAKAQALALGPLRIDAPERSRAWWVVDGQQRVVSLTACLTRPLPLPEKRDKSDPFVLFFDPEGRSFTLPPVAGSVPDTLVPLPALLDASNLSEWVFEWEHGGDEGLRRVVFEAGRRIREYPIPLYLIEGDDLSVAKEIFYRVNSSGKPLEWTEIFDALFGRQGAKPATLDELAGELEEIGMGRLGEDRLLTCLVAMRGNDPTRPLREHIRKDDAALTDAVRDSVPVLRTVLSFLRSDASIPHVRLLPKSILLDVLTRFFAVHGEPQPRSRLLLARWFWRTVLGAGAVDDRTLRRRGIQGIVEGEEERSVQNLLALVRKERTRALELPEAFDPRSDVSRIAMLTLAHLGPRDLESAVPIDVAGLLEERDKDAFAPIFRSREATQSRSPANRLIHGGEGRVLDSLYERVALTAGERAGKDDATLASHAVDAEAAALLAEGDADGFLARREALLTREMHRFAERMAAWDHADRPSVDSLLREAGVEV